MSLYPTFIFYSQNVTPIGRKVILPKIVNTSPKMNGVYITVIITALIGETNGESLKTTQIPMEDHHCPALNVVVVSKRENNTKQVASGSENETDHSIYLNLCE